MFLTKDHGSNNVDKSGSIFLNKIFKSLSSLSALLKNFFRLKKTD